MDLELEPLAARLAALPVVEEDRPPGERRAAVAMLLRFDRGEPEVLLMKRVEHPRDLWSGHISLPGGHAEDGEDLLAAALRETREEAGVDLACSARLLGRLPRTQAKARGRVLPLGITPFVFARTDRVEPVPGVEAEELFWFPLARAASGELSSVHRYRYPRGRSAGSRATLEESPERVIELPCWRFEGRVIWGLTHEMLSRFLRAVTPS